MICQSKIKIFFYEEKHFSWIFIIMKQIPLKVKKELINFRMKHSWSETCEKFPTIDDETWRLWMIKKNKILNTPELTNEELSTLKKQKQRQYREKYRKLHPDENPSVKRLIHPFVICSYYVNGNFKKYNPKNKSKFMKVNAFDIWKIAKKQKLICPITGLKLTAENMSADHIIPVSKGGTNLPSNLRLVHKIINHMKNHYSDKQFFDMCSLVVNNFKPITT